MDKEKIKNLLFVIHGILYRNEKNVTADRAKLVIMQINRAILEITKPDSKF